MNLVAPRQLTSLTEIAQTFRRSVATVKGWIEDEAPIHHDGKSYGADYHALNNWLVSRSLTQKNKQDSTPDS